jgi:hypothetical protein
MIHPTTTPPSISPSPPHAREPKASARPVETQINNIQHIMDMYIDKRMCPGMVIWLATEVNVVGMVGRGVHRKKMWEGDGYII